MGVNLKTMGEAGPGRDISDLFGTVRNTMHETLQTLRRLDLRGAGHVLDA